MLLVGDISTLPNKETQWPVQRSPRNQAAQNLSSHPATRARCRHFQGPAPSCRAQTSPVKSRQKIRLQNTHLVSTKSRWQKPPRHEVKHGLWICTSLTRKVGRSIFIYQDWNFQAMMFCKEKQSDHGKTGNYLFLWKLKRKEKRNIQIIIILSPKVFRASNLFSTIVLPHEQSKLWTTRNFHGQLHQETILSIPSTQLAPSLSRKK